MPVIKGNARTPVGNQIAKKQIKDGLYRSVQPVKENPGCPYTNPSKAKAKGMEHKIGKLG